MRLVVAKSQFEHKIKIPLVWGIFYYQTHKKNAGGCPPVFPNAPKGRKGEKEMGILNCQVGPRVQRRENVGGSLNPWPP